jgi:hypothetical protein
VKAGDNLKGGDDDYYGKVRRGRAQVCGLFLSAVGVRGPFVWATGMALTRAAPQWKQKTKRAACRYRCEERLFIQMVL